MKKIDTDKILKIIITIIDSNKYNFYRIISHDGKEIYKTKQKNMYTTLQRKKIITIQNFIIKSIFS
jgi:hypothetical protein